MLQIYYMDAYVHTETNGGVNYYATTNAFVPFCTASSLPHTGGLTSKEYSSWNK